MSNNDEQADGQPSAMEPLPIPATKIISLEHPCVLHDLQRSVKSLGRSGQLKHLLNQDGRLQDLNLPVSVRPEDIFATPIPSHHVPTSNVLMKVTVPKRTGRKRKRGSDEPFDEAEPMPSTGRSDATAVFRSIRDNESQYSVSVVGSVRDTYRYRAITQFQYAASSNPFMQYMKDNLFSTDFDKIKSFRLDSAQMLKPGQEVQPSPVLSIIDVPFPYNYRQNASVKIVKDQHGADYSINEAKTGSLNLCVVDYNVDKVPTERPTTLPPIETLDVKFVRLIKALQDGLLDRPVMTTRYQMHLTGEQLSGSLRRVLPYAGYMFKVGPFRDALIRYGFDPRSSSEYRGYQLSQVQITNADKKVERYGIGPPKPRSQVATYIFDGTEVYTDAKVFQFCDITDPILRKMLDDAPVHDQCEPFVFGWYGSGTWAIFRSVLKDKIDRLVRGDNKDQQWYEDIVKGFPDDIDDLPPGIRPPKGMDQEAAILLAKTRGLARTAQKSLQRKLNKGAGKQVRFDDTPGELADDHDVEDEDLAGTAD